MITNEIRQARWPDNMLVRLFNFFEIGERNECWIWQGTIHRKGYAYFHVHGGKKKTVHAHRLIYELVAGKIPDGLELDHKCRNRACVNPYHMEPVTNLQNISRSPIHYMNRTHCKNGHPLSGSNLYRAHGTHRRICRLCTLAAQKRYQKRRAA